MKNKKIKNNNKTNIYIHKLTSSGIIQFETGVEIEVCIAEKILKKYLNKYFKLFKDKSSAKPEDIYDAHYEFLKKLQIMRADFFSEIFIENYLKVIIKYYNICDDINDIKSIYLYRLDGVIFFFRIDDEDGFEKSISELLKDITFKKELFMHYRTINNYPPIWLTYIYPFDQNSLFLNNLYLDIGLIIIQLKNNEKHILIKKNPKISKIKEDNLINFNNDISLIDQEINYFYPGVFERIGIFENNYFTMEVDNIDLLKSNQNIIDITREKYIEIIKNKNMEYNEAKLLIRKGL